MPTGNNNIIIHAARWLMGGGGGMRKYWLLLIWSGLITRGNNNNNPASQLEDHTTVIISLELKDEVNRNVFILCTIMILWRIIQVCAKTLQYTTIAYTVHSFKQVQINRLHYNIRLAESKFQLIIFFCKRTQIIGTGKI